MNDLVGRKIRTLNHDGVACAMYILKWSERKQLFLVAEHPAVPGLARPESPGADAGTVYWISAEMAEHRLGFDQNKLKRRAKLQAKAHNIITEIETCYSAPLGASRETA